MTGLFLYGPGITIVILSCVAVGWHMKQITRTKACGKILTGLEGALAKIVTTVVNLVRDRTATGAEAAEAEGAPEVRL